MSSDLNNKQHSNKAGFLSLSLAALGIVYGDIGTSPLYAFKEAFAGAHGLPPTASSVLAALSALFWSVMLIISFKYVGVVLRFDNKGEGGVLALTALAHRLAVRGKKSAQDTGHNNGVGRVAAWVIGAGIFAAEIGRASCRERVLMPV